MQNFKIDKNYSNFSSLGVIFDPDLSLRINHLELQKTINGDILKLGKLIFRV